MILGHIGQPSRTGFYDGRYLLLVGGTVTGPVVLQNPTSTSGTGVLLNNGGTYQTTVPNGKELSAIRMDLYNQGTVNGQGLMYGIRLFTNSDATDIAAGISVTNQGKSDGIYVGVPGKSGSVAGNTPTGIGMDVNRGVGGSENSTTHAGYGIQVWDWSQTDTGNDTPAMMYLAKQNNYDTSHILLRMQANKGAVKIFTPEGTAYNGSGKLIDVVGPDNTTSKLFINADGSVRLGGTSAPGAELHVTGGSLNTNAAIFDSTNSNGANIRLSHTGQGSGNKYIRARNSNLDIVNSAYGAVLMTIADGGNVGIGTSSPTAVLHLKAGGTAVGSGALKFTAGTTLSTIEDGAVEYDAAHLYMSIGTTRYQLDQQSGTIAGSAIYTPATKVIAPVGYGNKADYYTDGTADDVEINAAITAVNGAGGGVVALKAGTYTIGSAVALLSNVILKGEGMSDTIIKKVNSASGIAGIQSSDGSAAISYASIRDLKVDGNRAGTATGRGINLVNSSNILLENVFLTDAVEGFKTQACSDVTFSQCIADGNYEWNYYQYSGTRIIIDKCQSLNAKAGSFEGFGMAFYADCSRCTVSDSYIYNPAHNGLQCNAGSATADVVGMVFSNNRVVSSGNRGIFMTDDTNTFHVKKAIVSGNAVTASTDKGIYLIDVYDSVVQGNRSYANTGDGICYDTCTNIFSVGNITMNNASGLRTLNSTNVITDDISQTNTSNYNTDGTTTYKFPNMVYPGYVSIGTTAIPNNTTGGDYTGDRLFIGNGTSVGTANIAVISAGNSSNFEIPNVLVHTTGSANTNIGGYLGLGGFVNGTATMEIFGGIAGRKENSTAANTRGYLQLLTNGIERARFDSNGKFGIGTTNPSAFLHIKAGGTAAGNAALKLTSGTTLTTIEDGAVEYDAAHLYFSIGTTRYQLDQQSAAPAAVSWSRFYNIMGG